MLICALDRRHRLEPTHLVVRSPLEFQPCTHREPGGGALAAAVLVGQAHGGLRKTARVSPSAPGRPPSSGTRRNPSRSRSRSTPTAEVLAALGDAINRSGTHVVEVGGRKISVVCFDGRAQMIEDIPGTEKAGILHKVLIPMVTSPLLGFVGGFMVMGLLYVCCMGGVRSR